MAAPIHATLLLCTYLRGCWCARVGSMADYYVHVDRGRAIAGLKPCGRDEIFASNDGYEIRQEAIAFCQFIDLDDAHIQHGELTSLLGAIPKFWYNNVTLKLDRNKLGTPGALEIANFLKHNNSKISTLSLSGNFMSATGGKAIAEALRTAKHGYLKDLYIGGNDLQNVGGRSFAALIQSNNAALEVLHLNGNNIGEDGLIAIARALGNNTVLDELDLQWNYMTTTGATEFGEVAKLNKELKVLLLSGRQSFRKYELCLIKGKRSKC